MNLPSDLRSLYPWTGHRLDVGGGVRLHYLDEGAGAPILALHGNPTWSFTFRGLVRHFAPTHRVVVPDHVGCGLSDKPDDDAYPYTLARRAQDVGRLVEHLDLRDVTLLVHDWGGAIGLAWALEHLERVRRVVVLNTAGFGLPPGKSLPWRIGVVRHLPKFPFPTRGLNAFLRGALMMCTTRGLSGRERRGYLAPYGSWADRIAIQRFVEDIPLQPGDPSWDTLQRITAGLPRLADLPVFVGWGGKDFVFDHHFLAEWERRLPHAEVHRYPEAGHWVHEDAPEALFPAIASFLARHP